MTPLLILLATYAAVRAWIGTRGKLTPGHRAARIALAAMLVATGSAHFVSTDAMAQMVPPFLPGGVTIVYVTGVLEFVAAALLLLCVAHSLRWLGWSLAAFFLAMLPANIHSAVAGVGLGGHGPEYLWFRVPLQVLFIGWALVSTGALQIRRGSVRTA